jgi:hypothetical protein
LLESLLIHCEFGRDLSACLHRLHLEALEDRCGRGDLVTLGEYRLLDGLEIVEALAREGACSWPPPEIVKGSTHLAGIAKSS